MNVFKKTFEIPGSAFSWKVKGADERFRVDSRSDNKKPRFRFNENGVFLTQLIGVIEGAKECSEEPG